MLGSSSAQVVPFSGSSRAPGVQVERSASSRRDVTAELCDPLTDTVHHVRVPRSDIEACVRFSYWRCIVTVIGFALVLTDIPRTGLSLSLDSYYKRTAPGVFWGYGPFAYPSIHINRSSFSENATYEGMRRGKPMASASVWAYKFDTLSIAQRAIATHLQVATYPDCILYRTSCPETTLPLATAFHMVDGWIHAMHSTYFTSSEPLPFVFLTRSNWLDRLHHVLLKMLWRRQDTRVHVINYFPPTEMNASFSSTSSSSWRLCAMPSTSRHRRILRPGVCDLGVKLRFAHPSPPPPPAPLPPAVSIPTHMELRLLALRRQYPDLQLDLTVVTTRAVLTSEPFTSLPIVFYSMENTEVTTWIRGRRCTSATTTSSSQCETVFVDDYRYEAGTLTTDADDWRKVTAALRILAQGYIWLRFLCLCVGAFLARSNEPKFQNRSFWRRMLATVATLGRIPSHTIVYGSWLPVCGYALAHVIDSGPTHLISNNVWSAINGLFTFSFVEYIQSATVQMRNVWMVAFVWKLVMVAYTDGHGKSRSDAWVPRMGVLAVRGIFISFLSWLTVFSFMRALRFRDTDVVAFQALPRHVPFNGLRFPPLYNNVADFGYRLDVKTTLTTTLLVALCAQVVQTIVLLTTNRRTRVIFCRSYYVPLSADTLFSRAKLNLFWNMRLNKPVASRSAGTRAFGSGSMISRSRMASLQTNLRDLSNQVLELGVAAVLPPTPNAHVKCNVCNRALSLLHWRDVQGCLRHDHLFRVEARQQDVWSMVRLVNLTLLSDPIVLVRVYVFGEEVYLYKLDTGSSSSSQKQQQRDGDPPSFFLLPALLPAESSRNTRHELVACVNSKAVPWNLLLNCG